MPYRGRIFFWKKMDHNPLSLLPVVSRMKFTIKKYFGGRNESWILISLKCSSKCTLPTWDESPLSSSTIGARLLQFSVFSKSKQIQRCIKIAHCFLYVRTQCKSSIQVNCLCHFECLDLITLCVYTWHFQRRWKTRSERLKETRKRSAQWLLLSVAMASIWHKQHIFFRTFNITLPKEWWLNSVL